MEKNGECRSVQEPFCLVTIDLNLQPYISAPQNKNAVSTNIKHIHSFDVKFLVNPLPY